LGHGYGATRSEHEQPEAEEMIEFRFHGRGGQGAVTSAELLALAAIDEGRFAQAFPSFGPERRGAPVVAFARIAEAQIRNRTVVQKPNVVCVLDPSILSIVNVTAGMAEGGTLVLNWSKPVAQLREEHGLRCRLAVASANTIAREVIGQVITNTTMLGALISATKVVGAEPVEAAIQHRFGRIAARNIAAFRRALDETEVSEEVAS
jgi:pyruvate ferredoxin oxidoreductase gamma subunit